ncbi:MAG: VWA domain-containing protein, partial [Deferribacteraceae bacterium]|nr:VWA domain-containing protein [Deferribacteraceae bacterium]
LFFPSEYDAATSSYTVEVSYKNTKQSFTVDRKAERQQSFTLPISSTPIEPVPVDILFVLDTTGSMGEEINRLRDMLLIIHDNLLTLPVKQNLRFGMVMYKDRGDDYITKKIPFTSDAKAFQRELSKISANGGGDTPEDMQTALEVSIKEMGWQSEGVKLAYVITDAEAHLDYNQKFTLLSAAQLAREKGIKLFSVGTGGLGIEGETNLRQIAQYTMGKYIFLTYGERGESDGSGEGGNPAGSVSHHTGENFTSENLEAVIIRFSKDEISAYARREIASPDDDYFEATSNPAGSTKGESNPKVLADLFSQMLTQLTSYSGIKLEKSTTVAVLPITADKALATNAEYFTEHLSQAAVLYGGWTAVERKDMQKILDEYALRLSGLTEDDTIELGSILNAQVLVSGTLYEKDGSYELYVKLLRAESGEVLSVTRAKIEKSLGL